MRQSEWKLVEEYFHQALSLPGERRQELLEKLAPETAERVRQLLAADEAEQSVLDQLIGGAAASWLSSRTSFELHPTHVGRYKILRPLGTGGMGAVFLAERDDAEFDKLVAIKILKAGFIGPEAAERFRRERQILAHLDHPFTARLLDGGTLDDGRPYLVMEFVDGETITTYAQREQLSIRQRCELVRKVAEAVAHAHQELVVHRDLKPSNILVDQRGNPRLLDFGIAKLMTTELDAATQQQFLTPQYASPEQLRGEPVTTAADVYGLGAILYELLTGEPPHSARFERLGNTELVPPSRRLALAENINSPRQRIPLDLDNIVLKAMAAEPIRRYRSAEQFGDDLGHFLAGEPVLARGDSIVYRTRKFVQRAWLPLAATLAIVVTLAVSAANARRQAAEANRMRVIAVAESRAAREAWDESDRTRLAAEKALEQSRQLEKLAAASAREARQERDRANERLVRLRQISGRLLFDLHDSIARLPGATAARKVVVQTALEQFNQMALEGQHDDQLLSELAAAYQRIGDVQGNPTNANLGDSAGALASYERAIALRTPRIEKDPAEAVAQLRTWASLADVQRQLGKAEAAEKTVLAALRWADAHPGLGDRGVLAYVGLERVLARLKMAQNLRESFPLFARALARLDSLPREVAATPEAKSERLLLLIPYSRTHMGDPQARPMAEEALALAQEFYAAHPGETVHANRLLEILLAHSEILRSEKPPQLEPALAEARRALDIAMDLQKADPVNIQAQIAVASVYSRIGVIEAARGHVDDAVTSLLRGAGRLESTYVDHPGSTDVLAILANTYFRAAESLVRGNRLPEAEPSLLRSSELYRKLLALDRRQLSAMMNLVSLDDWLGMLRSQQGRWEQAAEALERVRLATFRYPGHDHPDWRRSASDMLRRLGICYRELAKQRHTVADWAKAAECFDRALELALTKDPELATLAAEAAQQAKSTAGSSH